MKVVIGALRAIQLLFSVVVLGLSVSLAKGQVWGNVPSTTGYGSFTGGFGIIAAGIGIASLFVELLQGIIGWGVDALATLIFVAGGIAFTIELKGTNCGDWTTLLGKSILNCGVYKGSPMCGNNLDSNSAIEAIYESRCRMATADDAFMYMGFVVFAAALVVSFIAGRRKGGSGYPSYAI